LFGKQGQFERGEELGDGRVRAKRESNSTASSALPLQYLECGGGCGDVCRAAIFTNVEIVLFKIW
jgi:hypothetical protein